MQVSYRCVNLFDSSPSDMTHVRAPEKGRNELFHHSWREVLNTCSGLEAAVSGRVVSKNALYQKNRWNVCCPAVVFAMRSSAGHHRCLFFNVGPVCLDLWCQNLQGEDERGSDGDCSRLLLLLRSHCAQCCCMLHTLCVSPLYKAPPRGSNELPPFTRFTVSQRPGHTHTHTHTGLCFICLKCVVSAHLNASAEPPSLNHKEAPAAVTACKPLNQFYVPRRDSSTLSRCLSPGDLHPAGLQLLSVGTCPDYCLWVVFFVFLQH